MAKEGNIKIIIIDNKKSINQAIDIIYENESYRNHLEYWQEHLKTRTYNSVTISDLYSDTRNMIALKIALEDNIVFLDTSKKDSDYRSGIIFLPNACLPIRKKLIAFFTMSYDYLNIIYDIHYDGKTYSAKEKDIDRTSLTKEKIRKYNFY